MTAQQPGHWRRAFDDHKWLLAAVAGYIAFVIAAALYEEVPAWNLLHILGYILMSLLTALVFMTGIYLLAFCQFFRAEQGRLPARWMAATKRLDLAARAYMEGDRWTYACFAFLATLGDNFFFVYKSLIPLINPYNAMKWDLTFSNWDRALHFGRLPHEFVIPFVNATGIARLLDVTYALWLVVMFTVLAYNMFADTDITRRLRFLWTYVLSWIILGSAAATWLSSVGPLFLHDFYPDVADPYAGLVANFDSITQQSFFFVAKTRQLLLEWTLNDQKFDPNSLSAMPSMHVAISWLMVLYARHIGRGWCWAAAVFCLLVYLSTVYFGIHYAIDAYASIAVVTPLWWITGKMLGRRAAQAKPLKLQ